ncbi:MAG: MFS transporter [Lachnospiraceae bacterium]|nr:MFS transporter [Lachnospiraceae bacterium]
MSTQGNKGSDKNIMMFFLGCIVLNVAASTAHPVTPTLFTTLGLGSYMFGFALAAQLVTNFLFSPFWGWLSSYISSRKVLLITCCGYAFGQALFGMATTEMGFLVARALTGIVCGGCFVCTMTYVVNTAPNSVSRAKRLTTSATIQMVGSAFGYFLGGMLGEVFTHLAIIVQVIMLVVSGLIFRFACLDDAKYSSAELRDNMSLKEFNPFHSFVLAKGFLTPVFTVLFLCCLLQNLGFTCFDQTFNYYIRDQFNFSSGYNGLLKGIMGVITLIANSTICIWLIHNTNIRKSVIGVLAICSAAMFGVVCFENVIPFIIVFVIFFAFNSISLPLLQDLVASGGREDQNSLIMGFYNAMKSLGGIFGALFAGLLYTSNPRLPFIFGFASFVLATVLSFVYFLFSKVSDKVKS